MAKAFVKVASFFFRHREWAPSPSKGARILANLDPQWATLKTRAQSVYEIPVLLISTPMNS